MKGNVEKNSFSLNNVTLEKWRISAGSEIISEPSSFQLSGNVSLLGNRDVPTCVLNLNL